MTTKARTVLFTLLAVCGALATSHHGRLARVLASDDPGPAPPPTWGPKPIVRVDGSTKASKPAPAPESPKPVDACVVAQYAKLSAEVPALTAAHGAGTGKFAAEYKARKQALLSDAALRAAGCKTPGGK